MKPRHQGRKLHHDFYFELQPTLIKSFTSNDVRIKISVKSETMDKLYLHSFKYADHIFIHDWQKRPPLLTPEGNQVGGAAQVSWRSLRNIAPPEITVQGSLRTTIITAGTGKVLIWKYLMYIIIHLVIMIRYSSPDVAQLSSSIAFAPVPVALILGIPIANQLFESTGNRCPTPRDLNECCQTWTEILDEAKALPIHA